MLFKDENYGNCNVYLRTSPGLNQIWIYDDVFPNSSHFPRLLLINIMSDKLRLQSWVFICLPYRELQAGKSLEHIKILF